MNFSLDTTGQAASNYVASELHTVTPQSLANFGYIFLNNGPFFGRNLKVIYTPSAANSQPATLQVGIDFGLTFLLPGFDTDSTTGVWGAIDFYNPNLNGKLQISYQSLGGNWTFNQNAIANYLNSNLYNANLQTIQLVPSAPLFLPNNPNAVWPINSVQSITIAQAQLSNIDLTVVYVSLAAPSTLSPQVQPVQVVNLPATQTVVNIPAFTPTASSGAKTIPAASTDYLVLPANPSRRYLEITNTDPLLSLTVNVIGPAYVSPNFIGITLAPGKSISYSSAVPNTPVHVATEQPGVNYFVIEG